MTTMGLCPARCNWRSIMMDTRWPTCSDGAVGSKPIYPGTICFADCAVAARSEEHTSELQSLMRISYAVFCLKKKNNTKDIKTMRTISKTILKQTHNCSKYEAGKS